MQTVPASLIEMLLGSARPALIGHETPDADSVGSTGGLWLALRAMGKEPRLILPGGLSRKVEFLLRFCGLEYQADAATLAGSDVAIVLDTAKEKRVNCPGGYAALAHLPVANVDHHATNTGYGNVRWVDGQRSSTSEMVYEIIRALEAASGPATEGKPPIDVACASLLYAGIHSDTQGFSLANTTPRSLAVAHELAVAGARVAELCEQLDRSLPRSEFTLNQIVYANTRISDDGMLAWSSVSFDEIARSGCSADTIDDQVEIPRSVAGIRMAILFSEGEPGVVRMNFRGEGGTSVLPIAEKFGGGGHHAAAGARRRAGLEIVVAEVIAAARQYLRDTALSRA